MYPCPPHDKRNCSTPVATSAVTYGLKQDNMACNCGYKNKIPHQNMCTTTSSILACYLWQMAQIKFVHFGTHFLEQLPNRIEQNLEHHRSGNVRKQFVLLRNMIDYLRFALIRIDWTLTSNGRIPGRNDGRLRNAIDTVQQNHCTNVHHGVVGEHARRCLNKRAVFKDLGKTH